MKGKWIKLAAASLATCMIAAPVAGFAATASDGGLIAFLMPDHASTRYEQQDAPLFKKRIAELCDSCKVIYQNADASVAKQQQQVEAMIAQKADVIVIDPVDTTAVASLIRSAQKAGIKVVTYDRPSPKQAADFYVSFDNKKLGHMFAQSLAEHLKAEGKGDGNVIMVNGSPVDDAAMLIKAGAKEAIDASGLHILASYDTPGWSPQKAQDWVSGQIVNFKGKIDGVVASNDGTASGAIAAFKMAGVHPIPPVTGNDAEVAAIQRIIAGIQYNTISKPIKIVANRTAEVVVDFLNGKTPKSNATLFNTPSSLFVPTVVTAKNVKKVIFDGGIYTADQVCTRAYKKACEKLGIE